MAGHCNTEHHSRYSIVIFRIYDRTVFLQSFLKSPSINMIKGLTFFSRQKANSFRSMSAKTPPLVPERVGTGCPASLCFLLLPQLCPSPSPGAVRHMTGATTKPRSWTAANSSWTIPIPNTTHTRALAQKSPAAVC